MPSWLTCFFICNIHLLLLFNIIFYFTVQNVPQSTCQFFDVKFKDSPKKNSELLLSVSTSKSDG